MGRIAPFLPAFALVLLNTGLQVSGYENFQLAVALWILAGVLLLIPAWVVIRDWTRARERPLITPQGLLLVALVGAAIFLSLAAVAVVWSWKDNARLPANLEKRVIELQAQVDRLTKPRQLSDEQIQTMADFLLPRSHHTIEIYFFPTKEANGYAGMIHEGFRRGDWNIPAKGIRKYDTSKDHTRPEGVAVYAALATGAIGSGKSYDLAMEAMTKAKISYRGAGQWRSETGNEYVVIVVGDKETA